MKLLNDVIDVHKTWLKSVDVKDQFRKRFTALFIDKIENLNKEAEQIQINTENLESEGWYNVFFQFFLRLEF